MEREQSVIADEIGNRSHDRSQPGRASSTLTATRRGDGAGVSGATRTTTDSVCNGRLLRSVDPLIADLVDREARRQIDKLVMIPSESVPHPAVLDALASPFTSLYAEGYAPSRLRRSSLEDLARVDVHLATHRERGNRRFYQGAEFADLVESIAERRTAARFATDRSPAEAIHVNVQPLSGSVANLAAYEALLEPGDVLLAMALPEGGHLTHGSPYSVAGRRYHKVPYGTDPETRRVDYDEIRYLAREHRPRLLVGGFTSYPWCPDWEAFREIADEVGAFLLADIAHAAGLIVGGVYPNPVGIADVVTLTTHKTLCGPRGAAILSTDDEIAHRIDRAIFPGLQGGPHVNKIAAIAVAMELAGRDAFRDLQRRVVENARRLADALDRQGLTLAYGGTDTHLLLVDLRPLGLGGRAVARALDRVGIVCNQNAIPGDRNGADPHGIRLGTTWATQRGMGPDAMGELAAIVARVLRALARHAAAGGADDDFDTDPLADDLARAEEEVRALVRPFSVL